MRDLRECSNITSKVFRIDQLCINQHNDIEKGHQVALMGDIYRKASAVILYLGPSNPLDPAAIQLLRLLHIHFWPNYQRIFELTWIEAYRRSELEGAIRAVSEFSAYTTVMKDLGTSQKAAGQLLLSVIAEKDLQDELEPIVKGSPAISQLLYLRYWLPDIVKQRESLPEDSRTALISVESMIAELGDLLGVDNDDEPTEQERRIGSRINSQKVTYGRLVGVTKQHRVVNAQFKTKERDFISLLQGGVTPFVLRPVGDKFKFVGDICVPGIMYGEAYKNIDPEKVDYQIYLL